MDVGCASHVYQHSLTLIVPDDSMFCIDLGTMTHGLVLDMLPCYSVPDEHLPEVACELTIDVLLCVGQLQTHQS